VFTFGAAGKIRYRPKTLLTDEEHDEIKRRRDEIHRLIPEVRDPPLGLVAKWSNVYEYVSIHDPTLREWWDIPVKDAPGWALNESRRRKALYRLPRGGVPCLHADSCPDGRSLGSRTARA
jgi:hypothetical protein